MKRALLAALAGLVAGVVGLALAPAKIDPLAWEPPPTAPAAGFYAPNDRLKAAERLAVDLPQPEATVFDDQGRLFAGLADGRIVRMTADGDKVTTLATTGRPLGMKFGPDGRLYVCDALKGLLAVTEEGTVELLADSEGGVPFRLTDDLAIAANGTVYFTDASARFGPSQYVEDIIEHQLSGRLLKWEPATRQVTRLLAGLSFANGVALGPGDAWVLVNETGAYRIWRVWLKGPRAGEKEIFTDALPGFPDNITYSPERHLFWVALFAPRNPLLDALAPHPLLRRVSSHFPPPPARPLSFVVAVDESGRAVESLQWESPESYWPVTSALEHEGWLYLGSIEHRGLARVKLPAPR